MSEPEVVRDRYELVARIGSGGSGTVWRGRDTLLERDVALKQVRVPDDLPEEERRRIRERLLREARAAARLEHPSVTRVHDVIEDDGVPYLVMEFVDAPSLDDLVDADGPLDPPRAAAIGLAVLDGLHAAHAQGIIHRDVKPSNVLVPAHGPPMLTDFGIATFGEQVSVTSTGVVLGSPAYMAPEQAEDRDVGPPADLWALGATLYYAVEGRPPFAAPDPVRTLRKVTQEAPRPMERGGRLAPVIEQLLDKEPERRPDADELHRRLERVRDAETHPTQAQQPADRTATSPMPAARGEPTPSDGSTGEQPGRASTAGRLALLIGGAVLAVLVLGGAIVLLAGGGAIPTPDIPIAQDEDGDGSAAPEGPPQTEGVAVAAVPEDWQVHDPAGEPYAISHPPDWSLRQQPGNRTDIVDPSTGAYVRIDWTSDPHPDPVADRGEFAPQFAAQQSDYEEIRLEPATFRGHEAAVWEFTYVDGGVELHAVQLNVSGDANGYALHYQTEAGAFDEDEFGAFVTSFRTQE